MNLEEVFKKISISYGKEIGCYIEEEISKSLENIELPDYILIDRNKLDSETLKNLIASGAYNGN